MNIRPVINRLYTLLKFYVSLGLIGAMATVTFAFIESKPWIAAIIVVALEALLITLYLSNKINLVLEVGNRRLILGRARTLPRKRFEEVRLDLSRILSNDRGREINNP